MSRRSQARPSKPEPGSTRSKASAAPPPAEPDTEALQPSLFRRAMTI
jgi:hypothetical protein